MLGPLLGSSLSLLSSVATLLVLAPNCASFAQALPQAQLQLRSLDHSSSSSLSFPGRIIRSSSSSNNAIRSNDIPIIMERQSQHPELPLPDYFSKFAAIYANQTGHATLSLLVDVLRDDVQPSRHRIGPESVVHDTAAGPAIGAAALVASLDRCHLPRELLTSDNNAQMVQAARESLQASPLKNARCEELDSQDLKSVPDDYFTHSIDNFSIFTFVRPVDAVRETYRTLRPGGLAIVTCWERFAPMFMVHAAQKSIRPELPLLPTPSPEFYEEGVLQEKVEEAGFEHDNIRVFRKRLTITDDSNKAGLTALMSGPMMARAREGYTTEEEARWPAAVKKAVEEEVATYGGIRFDAYILLATK